MLKSFFATVINELTINVEHVDEKVMRRTTLRALRLRIRAKKSEKNNDRYLWWGTGSGPSERPEF